ncbi:Beta-glucuronidase [Thalassocella blandensis]|nr:Beta-glucuronidase [Thalassocella blandensis]
MKKFSQNYSGRWSMEKEMLAKLPCSLLWLSLICSVLFGHAALASSSEFELLQNPQGRSVQTLDGQWNIIIDPYENGFYNHRYQEYPTGYFKNKKAESVSELVEYNFNSGNTLRVPGDWNTQRDELFFYEGTVWYEKDFRLEKAPEKQYLLRFGAVNYKAVVYVNGEKVGSHEGGFTPFEFNVTKQLSAGENFLVVKVDNRRERNQIPTVNTDWWNYGGITRPVSLIELDSHYVQDYSIQYSPKDSGQIYGWLQAGGVSTAYPVEVKLQIPELEIDQAIRLTKSGFAEFSINASPVLWTPERPRLYQVKIHYGDDVLTDEIGFRYIEVKGEDILLNGESLFLRGISIHEESPRGDGRAWSNDDAATLLHWAKELNCNFVRLAHYPHNENMVKMADKMGLLVWSEIPVYWTVLFENQEVYQKAERQLSEMISRDKNRASIMFWSVANETPSHKARYRFLKRLVEKARELDETRLITAALDTQSSSATGKVIDDPFAAHVDVIGVNSYCGWYADEPKNCAGYTWESKYNKPVIMSEFGAGALQGKHSQNKLARFSEENQEYVYQMNLAMLDNFTALKGVTPWILKDFRSPRRPLTGIQDFWNRKGLLSEVGVKKKAWYVLKDWYDKKQEAEKGD